MTGGVSVGNGWVTRSMTSGLSGTPVSGSGTGDMVPGGGIVESCGFGGGGAVPCCRDDCNGLGHLFVDWLSADHDGLFVL